MNRDVGIVFAPALSFNDHIDDAVRAASKTYGFIKRSITAYQKHVFVLFFY